MDTFTVRAAYAVGTFLFACFAGQYYGITESAIGEFLLGAFMADEAIRIDLRFHDGRSDLVLMFGTLPALTVVLARAVLAGILVYDRFPAPLPIPAE